jgi:TraR antiactivator
MNERDPASMEPNGIRDVRKMRRRGLLVCRRLRQFWILAMRIMRGDKMHDAENADDEEDRASRILAYTALDKADLEAEAVAAIRQLRLLTATAQVLYDDWLRAEEDPTSSKSVLRQMQEDYLRRQRGLCDKQNAVSELIDALGYVPEIPD